MLLNYEQVYSITSILYFLWREYYLISYLASKRVGMSGLWIITNTTIIDFELGVGL
jgi:hypothetical protein